MSAPLAVGIDIDGVLADYTGALRVAGRALGISLSGEAPPSSWSMIEPGWFESSDDWKLCHAVALRKVDSFVAIGGAEDIGTQTGRLRDAGHRVVILTAREAPAWQDDYGDMHVQGATRDWLDMNLIGYDELRFDVSKTGHGLDVLLDDGPHNIEEYRAAGERAVIYDHAYNRHLDGERVSSLSEYVDLLLA